MKETKHNFMGITSIILCLAMFLVFMPQAILAEAGEVHASSRLVSVVLEENGKPGEEAEYVLPDPGYPEIIVGKAGDHAARLYYKEEMNTLVYVNDDGAETLYMFGMNVKYTDESGEIKDKSTKLAFSEEGYYNPDNDIRVTFAKDLENGVGVTYNDIVISVRPAELKESVKQAELRKIALPEEDERERVIYEDAFEKADIVYTPTFDGFKEDIVVNSYNGVTEYVFAAFTENARIEGHDIFRGEERIGDIGAIYVLDSEGECTYGVLEVEEIEPGEYLLTVSVDAEFLANAAYPVYIDPSITIYSYSSGPKLIEDAPVYSGSSSANGTNKYNYCGYVSSSLGYGRVLYRLTGLTCDYTYYQISASQIDSVVLHLREASGKSGSATVTARPFLETWTESGVKFSNVNVNNYNSSSTYAASKTYSSSPKWWEFEIKETVKAWKNNTFNSWYGIVLINSNESSSTYYRNFLSTEYTNSSYYPYITMDYTPNIVVSPSTKTMYVGETFTPQVTTCPSGISYTWFSMDSSYATVNSTTGEITAVAPGTTYIVANGGANGSGTCVVTVLDFSIGPTELNFVVWDDFELIYININGEESELNYNEPHYNFETDRYCYWSVGDESIISYDDYALQCCYIYVNNNGVEGTTTLSCTIIGTNITRTCTINVIRITSNDIHVSFLNGTNVEINNDEMPNSYNLNAQIYATKNGVTYNLDTDEYITYSVQQCYDKYGAVSNELQNHVSVNSTTGVVSVQQANAFNAAHPTGTAQIRAKCTKNSSKFAEKAVTVKCSDHPFVSPDDNTADHVHGRYIRIPHTDQYSYHNYDDFVDLLTHYYGNSADHEYISANEQDMYEFELSSNWIQYNDCQLPNNTRRRKLLHLIASSKICTIWSHGDENGISCNTQDSSVVLTKDMIRSVHDGFFNYTELLFLTTCLSGYTNGATDPSIMQLFADKGVKVVAGFENSPQTSNCKQVEETFYGYLCTGCSVQSAYNSTMSELDDNAEGFIIITRSGPNGSDYITYDVD